MSIIDQDIKNGQFHNIYLIIGDEEYLKNRYANQLVDALIESKDSMNYNEYDDKACAENSAEIISTAVTLPFFADHRVINIKNSGWFKNKNDDFLGYLDEPNEDTIFIFREASFDRRSRAYKAASKLGCIVECTRLSSNDIKKWIGEKLKSENKSMKKEAFIEFEERTNSSMDNMEMEFDKLISYIGERKTITLEDVEAVCTKQLQSKVFDMIDAIAEKNPTKVFDMYHDLLASKESPLKILVLIQRAFRQSLQIKDLRDAGYSEDRIIKELNFSKKRGFIVNKTLRMTKNFSKERMNELLNEACELECDIKTGRIKEQLAVELLMMKYSC